MKLRVSDRWCIMWHGFHFRWYFSDWNFVRRLHWNSSFSWRILLEFLKQTSGIGSRWEKIPRLLTILVLKLKKLIQNSIWAFLLHANHLMFAMKLSMERRTSKFWTSTFESLWTQRWNSIFWMTMQFPRLYLKISETVLALVNTQHGLKNAE